MSFGGNISLSNFIYWKKWNFEAYSNKRIWYNEHYIRLANFSIMQWATVNRSLGKELDFKQSEYCVLSGPSSTWFLFSRSSLSIARFAKRKWKCVGVSFDRLLVFFLTTYILFWLEYNYCWIMGCKNEKLISLIFCLVSLTWMRQKLAELQFLCMLLCVLASSTLSFK